MIECRHKRRRRGYCVLCNHDDGTGQCTDDCPTTAYRDAMGAATPALTLRTFIVTPERVSVDTWRIFNNGGALTFQARNDDDAYRTILTLSETGAVTFGEGVEPNEAARALIEATRGLAKP